MGLPAEGAAWVVRELSNTGPDTRVAIAMRASQGCRGERVGLGMVAKYIKY